MDKELTPLKALYKLVSSAVEDDNRTVEECLEYQHIIENALKEKEETDNAIAYGGGIYAANGIIDKQLKALEIIKNKRIDIDLFIDTVSYGLEKYNEVCATWAVLTLEEYELLKEVLK